MANKTHSNASCKLKERWVSGSLSFRPSGIPGPRDQRKGWRKEDVALVEGDQVREYLSRLDIWKSIRPDGMHTWALRELADVISRPLLIIFDWSWRLEVPKDWRKVNVTFIFKKCKREDPVNYRPATLIPGNVMEQLMLETIRRHIKDKIIRSSHHGFTKGQSCLTNLISFYDEMAGRWGDCSGYCLPGLHQPVSSMRLSGLRHCLT